MAGKLLFLVLICFATETLAQHSAYSLQDAVDALRRREAQLALRNSFNEPAPPSSHYIAAPSSEEEEFWNQEPVASPSVHINRHQLNKLLARYLAREEDDRDHDGRLGLGPFEPDFDDDNYISEDEKKKRSFFRERDGKYDPQYASVFRERELAPYDTPELAEEFLREIDHEKDLERERKYKEALQRLWEKYEQQENEIKDDIFDEDEKKKRQLLPYLSPMERKRSYPVLPWLPATRKKRFPVAKRSPRSSNEAMFGASGTDEKVARDLDAIFNEPAEDKKKRSADNGPSTTPQSTSDNNIDKKNTSAKPHASQHHHRGSHDEATSEEESHEGHEHEHDHAHDHDHEEDEEEDHDFDDEDEEDRKKKREVAAKKRSNQEVVREDQIIPGDLSEFRRKKSIDWSQYFGMDRRKKSGRWSGKSNSEVKKRSTGEEEEDKRKKKSVTDSEKLDNMDKKLKTIEDLIIDETVKYTGAHEGISDPDDIRNLKDHVVSRLATAYSLEKMRRALDKFRQSVEDERHLQRNEIEPETNEDEKEKAKRVAIKKEKVQFDNNQHSIESDEKNHEQPPNDIEENDEDKRKKKKRNGGGMAHRHSDLNLSDFEDELGAGHFEPQLYEGYPGSRSYNYLESSQCPMLDAMADRCRSVDLLSGDIRQEFLPICGVHQLCYLCGTSQTACDFQYLSEADSICGRNNDCQSAARAALMILRGTPGPQLGPKECMKNHCLYRAMKEIGL